MKTTVNGKTINFLTKQDISAFYTMCVQSFLNNGYVFNYSENSRGSQGEDIKVTLTNDGGKTAVVVYISNSYHGTDATVVEVVAKRYADAQNQSILWLKEGELIYSYQYYLFKTRGTQELYVTDYEDYKLLDDIQFQRYMLRNQIEQANTKRRMSSDKFKKIAFNKLRNKSGYKTVRLHNIECVYRINGVYYASIAGKGNVSLCG